MTLEEDLKARTLALISQQMANWVVEIQRTIAGHQEGLVRSLDEIQEQVARYDEKINEGDIEMAIAEVVSSQPPTEATSPGFAGPGYDQLKQSLAAIEQGTSLSEVLTYLVNEVAQQVDRAAMFIIKGSNAIGWYARGIDSPDVIKSVNISLNSDTIFRNIHNSRNALRGHITHSPGTAQALTKLGGDPQGILGVPLVLRDKLAAILYCDTQQEEVPQHLTDMIEVLVLFAGKTIDILAMAPKPSVPAAKTTGNQADRAAALRAGGDDIRERAGVPRAAAPAAAPAVAQDEGSSTVMFNAASFAAMRQATATAPKSAPVAAPAPSGLSPEEQKSHEDAKRFARLVVSEIKLYNETKVNEGRKNKDLYERLKEDIERGRQMYEGRVAAGVRDSTNYFFDELVRILAGGDAGALGPM
jgi:hypothetical protein